MEGYFPLKLKRKDLEDVSDDFSEFSLASPARKIRRLDAELPPIMEEEECEIPTVFENLPFPEQRFDCNPSGGIKIEELPNEPSNDQRAIVLFKPIADTPLVHSPSDFSVSVNPELISGLKNRLLWSSRSNSWQLAVNEASENNNSNSGNGCLAVIPWVPPQQCPPSAPVAESLISPTSNSETTSNSEMMEDENLEEARMDVEDGYDMEQRNGNEMRLSEGINYWQQQHCLIPQPPQNATSPIVWYR